LYRGVIEMARGGLAQPDPPGVRAKKIRHAAERLARGALLGRRAVEGFRHFLEDSQRTRLGKTTAILQRQRLFVDAALFLGFIFVFFAEGFLLLFGLVFFAPGFVFLIGFAGAARRAVLSSTDLLGVSAGLAE